MSALLLFIVGLALGHAARLDSGGIQGVNIFPFWLLVVGAVALLGSARPNPKALLHASQEVGKSFWQRLSGQAHRPSNLPDSKRSRTKLDPQIRKYDATAKRS